MSHSISILKLCFVVSYRSKGKGNLKLNRLVMDTKPRTLRIDWVINKSKRWSKDKICHSYWYQFPLAINKFGQHVWPLTGTRGVISLLQSIYFKFKFRGRYRPYVLRVSIELTDCWKTSLLLDIYARSSKVMLSSCPQHCHCKSG